MTRREKTCVAALTVYALAMTAGMAFERSRGHVADERCAEMSKEAARRKQDVENMRRRLAELQTLQEDRPGSLAQDEPAQEPHPGAPSNEPQAPAPDPGSKPPEKPQTASNWTARTRAAFESLMAARSNRNHEKARIAQDELELLIRSSPEVHLALMDILREARSEAEMFQVEALLVHNKFIPESCNTPVQTAIWKMARELLDDPNHPERREAAAKVLLGYPDARTGKSNAPAVLDAWRRESSLDLKDTLLEQLAFHGPYPMEANDTGAILEQIRNKTRAGDERFALSLSTWSRDPDDFRLMADAFLAEQSGNRSQLLLSGFRGDRPIARGSEGEARAILVGVMNDRKENAVTAEMAYRMLRDTWLPWDADTETAVRKYEAEHK